MICHTTARTQWQSSFKLSLLKLNMRSEGRFVSTLSAKKTKYLNSNKLVLEKLYYVQQLWRKMKVSVSEGTFSWSENWMTKPPERPFYCRLMSCKCSAGVLLCWQSLKLPHLPLNGTAAHNYSFDQLVCRVSKSLLLLAKCQRFMTKALYLLGNMKNCPFYFPAPWKCFNSP